MWKKAFIRSTLIIIVALAGILVFTSAHTAKKPASDDCNNTQKDCCKKAQSDFIIWESLSRSIMVNFQY